MQATAFFKITVCGIEELAEYCEARVSHVVILDPAWPVPAALERYRDHERLELRFDGVIEPAVDKVPPEAEHIRQLLTLGWRLVAAPTAERHLLIHCGAGFSRSPAAVALLLAQAAPALLILLGVLVRLCNNLLSYSFQSYQSELFPTRIRSRAIGFVYSWSRLSAALSGLVVAFLLNLGGVNAVFAFIAFALAVVVATIGGFGPRTRGLALEAIAH